MSSRIGNIILGEWLLDEVKKKLKKNFPNLYAKTAEIVAVGATKYSILKQGVFTPIRFDIDESISIRGNSGPYLQYTYARCRSVLVKAGGAARLARTDPASQQGPSLLVLKWLDRFPEVVSEAAENYAPNLICAYLYELAQKYNTFYQQHSVLKAKTKAQKELRLAMTRATAQVLKNGLYLLGIKVPAKM